MSEGSSSPKDNELMSSAEIKKAVIAQTKAAKGLLEELQQKRQARALNKLPTEKPEPPAKPTK